MRKPKVDNKYNLTVDKIQNLKVDKTKVTEPLFWRNNFIGAWCIGGDTAKSSADYEFCTYNSFWLGIFDENAKSSAGKIRLGFTSYGGMCDYKIKEFYREEDIDCEIDLEIQEKCLEKINYLIDNKILLMEEKEN